METTESRSRVTPRRAAVVEFELVEEVGEYGEVVDSVCSLGGGLVAAKCVSYGKILVFRCRVVVALVMVMLVLTMVLVLVLLLAVTIVSRAEFPALEEQGRTGNLCRVEVLAEFAWRTVGSCMLGEWAPGAFCNTFLKLANYCR